VAEFHELAVSLWQAGNTNSLKRPDFREVDILADIARNGAMGRYLESHHDLMAEFYSPFYVKTKFDPIRSKWYLNLPAGFVKLRESFIIISPVQNDSVQFIHTLSGDEWLFKGLDAENMEGQTSYKVENKKVIFKGLESQYHNSEVLVKMIANISNLSDTDTFPVPQMFEQEILDYVLSKLQIQETVPLKDEEKP